MRKEVNPKSLKRRRIVFVTLASFWLIFAVAWPLSIWWTIVRDAPGSRIAIEDGMVHYLWNIDPPHPDARTRWFLARTQYGRSHGFLMPYSWEWLKPNGESIGVGVTIVPL